MSDVAPTKPAIAESSVSLGEQYADQARESFRDGDYRQALRLAQHAAIDMPRDPAVHELMSLALFALKDYRGAAIEAHAALALGPPIDWPTLYTYYGNADTYTAQLRALEGFVRDNPKAAAGPLPAGLPLHHHRRHGCGQERIGPSGSRNAERPTGRAAVEAVALARAAGHVEQSRKRAPRIVFAPVAKPRAAIRETASGCSYGMRPLRLEDDRSGDTIDRDPLPGAFSLEQPDSLPEDIIAPGVSAACGMAVA